jgi:hypothetical protein
MVGVCHRPSPAATEPKAAAPSATESGTWFSAGDYLAWAQANGIAGSTAGQGPYPVYRGAEVA